MKFPINSPFSNVDKNVLITGGAGLLGIQHCEALLETGATVVLADINQELLSKAKKNFKGEKVIFKELDITSSEKLIQVADELEEKDCSIDILINNAAINPKVSSSSESLNSEQTRLENYDENLWDIELAVGLKGAFLCSKIFGTRMAKKKLKGVILNIASDLSVISPYQNLYKKENTPENLQPVKPITYSVIKAGLIGMTKYLSTYWSDIGIRCNAISPGGVFTDQPEVFKSKLSKLIPLGRMARIDEYKCALQFLCSDASSYITGQNIIIDGGRSTW